MTWWWIFIILKFIIVLKIQDHKLLSFRNLVFKQIGSTRWSSMYDQCCHSATDLNLDECRTMRCPRLAKGSFIPGHRSMYDQCFHSANLKEGGTIQWPVGGATTSVSSKYFGFSGIIFHGHCHCHSHCHGHGYVHGHGHGHSPPTDSCFIWILFAIWWILGRSI